jgi:tetratricopeptide (TPR) repeat protein
MRTFDDIMARIISVEDALAVHHDLRDVDGVMECVVALRALLAQVPNPLYTASCDAIEGWALVKSGKADEGLTQARRAHAKVKSAGGWYSLHAAFVYANVCLESKAVEEGLATINVIEEFFEHSDIRRRLSEVLRIKGELLLLNNASDSNKAEQCFRKAIDVAKEQRAKWAELSSTISLARLLRDKGHADEARPMLADIYNWFTEGFDTADLKDAKALLDELGC